MYINVANGSKVVNVAKVEIKAKVSKVEIVVI